jgi:hypothetical protein
MIIFPSISKLTSLLFLPSQSLILFLLMLSSLSLLNFNCTIISCPNLIMIKTIIKPQMLGSPVNSDNLVLIIITFASYSLVSRLLSFPITIDAVEFII